MKREPGRTRWKLAEMLTKALTEREGFPVNVEPYDLWTQQGDYRKSEWDLARWGWDGKARHPETGVNHHFSIHSWDRMKDCVRGFTITGPGYRDLPGNREVHANEIK